MKILLTGGKGMLGRTLQKELSEFEVVATDLPELDITDIESVRKGLVGQGIDVVIHCAAMTAVDKCESEKDLAYRLNELGSMNVAKVCDENNIKLIGISTDYVFDGSLDRAYSELDVPTGGDTVYGQSKLAGEEAIRKYCKNHIIARISWLYGAGGPSFVHTMVNLADGTRPELKVVNDQIGNPTSTLAVARGVRNLLKHPELRGVFHLTCEGEATWYEFAKEIFRQMEIEQKVVPCTTSEFVRPAARPANSRLEKRMLKLNNLPVMPNWQDALAEFIELEFGK